MSEYQRYEFVAFERPLTVRQMAELRTVSTRAEITPTRFFNEYPTHILVRNRMMEMAISVLSMIVGGGSVKAHSNEASFIAAIAEGVPGFRQLPKFVDLPPILLK